MRLFEKSFSQRRRGAENTKENQEFLPLTTRTITNHHLDVGQQVRGVRVVRGLFFLLIFCCLFFSCTEPNDSGNLNGTWVAYDSYIINSETKKIEYDGGDGGNKYKADIVNSPDYEAKNGVFIIKFTYYCKVIWNDDWTAILSEEVTNEYNNKFGAVYWRNLTSNSVEMADAYNKTTWVLAIYNNLPDAQTNFTIDRAGDFIGQWGSFTK